MDKFREMIVNYVEENDLDMADVAAALTYENQKERPLFPKLIILLHCRKSGKAKPEEKNRDKKPKNKTNKSERVIRDEEGQIVPMVTYRLEVGKNDNVDPRILSEP